MAIRIRIPAALRRYTDGAKQVTVSGGTLGELLADAAKQHTELQARLFDAAGALRADARVFVNGDEPADGLAAAVADGAEVTILPPIAGA